MAEVTRTRVAIALAAVGVVVMLVFFRSSREGLPPPIAEAPSTPTQVSIGKSTDAPDEDVEERSPVDSRPPVAGDADVRDLIPDLMTTAEGIDRIRAATTREEWDRLMVERSFDIVFDMLRDGRDLDALPPVTSRRVNPRGVTLTPAELADLQGRVAHVSEEIRAARIAYELERFDAFLAAGPPRLIPSPTTHPLTETLAGTVDTAAINSTRRALIEELQAQYGGADSFDFMVATAFWEHGPRPESLEALAAMADEHGHVPASREGVYCIHRGAHPKAFLAKDHLADRRRLRDEIVSSFFAGLQR